MAHSKPHLPSKTCPVCQRPFNWRKKWARVWSEVKYCSERCKREAKAHNKAKPNVCAAGSVEDEF